MTISAENENATFLNKATARSHTSSDIRTIGIYTIFTASGAAGLIYQVIWARWLGLVFGNTTVSVSIVLSSFMLGLALGSWLIGRRLHLIQNPMRLYAFLELGIAVFAICFPILASAVEQLFTAVVHTDSPLIISFGLRSILVFVLLLLPTTLMGATLPLLTDFFKRNPTSGRSWKVGILYAVNTLGAALGTILAGFFLIELIGVLATTRVAALLNVVVALIGFKYSFQPQSGPDSVAGVSCRLHRAGKIALMVLTANGAIALASEVLWTRTLETIVGNSTYDFSLIVVVYLVGIALGSWLMSLFVGRIKKASFWLVALQAGMGLWTLIAIFLIDLIRANIFSSSITGIPVHTYLWNCFKSMSILVPLALLSGASFPLATRIIEPQSNDAQGSLIARAYAWNTIGAVFGSLVAGFAIAPYMDFFQSLYFLAALYGLIGLIAYLSISPGNYEALLKKPASLAYGGLLLLLVLTAFYQSTGESHFVERFQARFPHRQVVFHKPGLQGITTVAKEQSSALADQLLINGMGMTVKITDTKMMAHLPLLMHPDPVNTLVICFGMGTTFRSAISHNGAVTVVELTEEVYEAFPYFYDDADRVQAYPKGQFITNDGRNFLRLTRDRYDVITIDPPPPIDAAGVTNLYSKDFLELAQSRLKDGGIMAHWIPLPGKRAGVDDRFSFRMLLATFKEVYPYSYILPAWNKVGVHVLGSTKPIEFSLDKIKDRLAANASVARDLNEWEFIPPEFFSRLEPLELPGYRGLIITDDRPSLEFNLLRYISRGTRKSTTLTAW